VSVDTSQTKPRRSKLCTDQRYARSNANCSVKMALWH